MPEIFTTFLWTSAGATLGFVLCALVVAGKISDLERRIRYLRRALARIAKDPGAPDVIAIDALDLDRDFAGERKERPDALD